MVPHFTGRHRECEDITGHVISKSTRIVSIWGSPGFGKTSIATAVGHQLQSKGLPVYFFSLRGLQSKTDLTSKMLSFFKRPSTKDQMPQRLSIDEELFQLLSEIPDEFVLILDNADDLLESGASKVKEEFVDFLGDTLRRAEKITFVITTRESLEFMDVHFQGHKATRIGPLDESFSQTLVCGLLPNAVASDCLQIANICGHVPLAMKLLCSTISEDDAQRTQFLEDFKESIESNIVELLDNPDYPSNLRLKLLFESSFQRLSAQEKDALVSLSILPEDFNLSVAAAVIGIKTNLEAKKVLQRLRRKSLLDSTSRPESFSMHKLLLSFAREKGEDEMKETVLKSKARLCAFYVSHFEKLNEQFLTGRSMSAFIDFYEEKRNIIQSLIETCSNPKTCDLVFGVLIKAELFLDTLFWCEGEIIDTIYDSATEAAKKLGKQVFYRQLLVSFAFTEVTWGIEGRTMKLLSEVDDKQVPCCCISKDNKGKLLCYRGICQVAAYKTDEGVHNLQEALSMMNGSPEQRILRIIAFQILAIYHCFNKNLSVASHLYRKALQECRAAGDTSLLVIPPIEHSEFQIDEGEIPGRKSDTLISQPLRLEIMCVLSKATEHFSDNDAKQSISNTVLKIAKEPNLQPSLGACIFQRNVNSTLNNVLSNPKEAAKLSAARISYHEIALKETKSISSERQPKWNVKLALHVHQEALLKSCLDHGRTLCLMQNYFEALSSYHRALDIALRLSGEEHSSTAESYHALGVTQHKLGDFSSALQSFQRSLEVRVKVFGEVHSSTAASYHSLGIIQHDLGEFTSALQSFQRALDIRVKLFGEEHSSTAESYHLLGVTQHKLGDFTSALQSFQRSVDVRVKAFGEEHSTTAESYHSLGVTQHDLGYLTSALQSKKRALEIREELFREEHSTTADTYHSLGVTQHELGDFPSALQSTKRALDIRVKLLGEEHSSTAASYHSLGIIQHDLGEFTSALQSFQRALDIRVKLFGEEHSSTAESYHLLGVTHHKLGDFTSALQSFQRSVDVRVKAFGEEHSTTAESYHSLGVTQHDLGYLTSALQSKKRALEIREELFREEHSTTADTYHSLGVTQHELGDFTSALQSFQRALEIRVKLLGEEHSSTAESYHALGVTQHKLGDFTSALQSFQRSVDVRVKTFGEEHSSTAESYHSLGVTQHELGDFTSALQSKQRALDIRVKLFGEEHSSTAESYHALGVTQYELGDFTSALQSFQRSLDVRVKVFGEEHSSTAESYHLLGVTQHKLSDFTSARQSKKRALDIRVKLLGEEHSSTAESYHSLGVTQHELGDFTSALQSKQRALDIRVKRFGEQHSSTAESYLSLGVTQHELGDFTSSLQSKSRALDIRVKLLGEEHSTTADTYHSLGVTQHELGDFPSALQSIKRALDIRVKLFGEKHSSTAESYHSLWITQHARVKRLCFRASVNPASH